MSNSGIHWPDGRTGIAPSDGFHYWVGNKRYMWDDFVHEWCLVEDLDAKVALDGPKCQCGKEATNQPAHSTWCDLYKPVVI